MKRDTLWWPAKKKTTSGFGLFPESAESATEPASNNKQPVQRELWSVLADGN